MKFENHSVYCMIVNFASYIFNGFNLLDRNSWQSEGVGSRDRYFRKAYRFLQVMPRRALLHSLPPSKILCKSSIGRRGRLGMLTSFSAVKVVSTRMVRKNNHDYSLRTLACTSIILVVEESSWVCSTIASLHSVFVAGSAMSSLIAIVVDTSSLAAAMRDDQKLHSEGRKVAKIAPCLGGIIDVKRMRLWQRMRNAKYLLWVSLSNSRSGE